MKLFALLLLTLASFQDSHSVYADDSLAPTSSTATPPTQSSPPVETSTPSYELSQTHTTQTELSPPDNKPPQPNTTQTEPPPPDTKPPQPNTTQTEPPAPSLPAPPPTDRTLLAGYVMAIRDMSQSPMNRESFVHVYELLLKVLMLDKEVLEQGLLAVWNIYQEVSTLNEAYRRLPSSPPGENFAIGSSPATRLQVAVLSFGLNASQSKAPRGFSLIAGNEAESLQFAADDNNTVLESSSLAIAFDNPAQLVGNRYVIVVYPTNLSLYAAAVDNRVISRFRGVDIHILNESPTSPRRPSDQVQVYFNPDAVLNKRACAVWSSDLPGWSGDQCHVGDNMTSFHCSCNLTTVLRTQILVYEYTEVTFNASLFAELVGGQVYKPDLEMLKKAASLVHDVSVLALSDTIFKNVFQVYSKILGISMKVLEKNTNVSRAIYSDLEKIARRYAINNGSSYSSSFKAQAGAKGASALAVIVLGYFNHSVADDPRGFTLTVRHKVESTTFFSIVNSDKTLSSNLAFACFLPAPATLSRHRFIFTVYPIDQSLFPISVANRTVFRSRQIDIYVATTLRPLDDILDEKTVNFYFHLSPPKHYRRKACTAWDSARATWTDDTCSVNTTNAFSICSCDLTRSARSVTRVMLYEYVLLNNPTRRAKDSLPGMSAQDAIFFLVTLFSLFGFTTILATAFFIPQWRQPSTNKALVHLTAAAMLHLGMLWLRQSYDTNEYSRRRSLTLLVALNYSRLAHCCWQLAIVIAMIGVWVTPEVHRKVSLLAWVVPLLPLALLLAWNRKVHFFQPDRVAKYVLYLLPAFGSGLVNIALMASVVVKITNVFGLGKPDYSVGQEVGYGTDVAIGQLATVILMFFFFGVTTVFELVFELGRKTPTEVWLFKVTAPAPGLLLCLLFVVFDSRTRSLWKMLKRNVKRWLKEDSRNETAIEMSSMAGTYRVREQIGTP